MAYGTLHVTDTLQSLRVANGTVATFGEDRAWEAVNALLIAHNRIMGELLQEFCVPTTERLWRYGGPDSVTMEELDSHGVPQAQKVSAGSTLGLPLRKYGAGLQWTRDYFKVALVSEFAAQLTALLTADVQRVQRQIKRALYTSTNYTFFDRLIDNAQLAVKALVNADSQPIPVGPNGETFNAATHTHFLATASMVAANVDSLILTVIEHRNAGNLYIVINQAQEAAFRALTGFVAYIDPRVIAAENTVRPGPSARTLDVINVYNRPIGIYGGAEVWVKPWAVANYVLCYITGSDDLKPLGLRVRGTGPEGTGGGATGITAGTPGNSNSEGNGDLQLTIDNDAYPLRAKAYYREFDLGVRNRVSAAVLYIAGGSYTNPTIN